LSFLLICLIAVVYIFYTRKTSFEGGTGAISIKGYISSCCSQFVDWI